MDIKRPITIFENIFLELMDLSYKVVIGFGFLVGSFKTTEFLLDIIKSPNDFTITSLIIQFIANIVFLFLVVISSYLIGIYIDKKYIKLGRVEYEN